MHIPLGLPPVHHDQLDSYYTYVSDVNSCNITTLSEKSSLMLKVRS